MANLGIRSIPSSLYKLLKERAQAENRSLNQEVLWLLRKSLMSSFTGDEGLWNRINKRRMQIAKNGGIFSDSVELLRKDRQR